AGKPWHECCLALPELRHLIPLYGMTRRSATGRGVGRRTGPVFRNDPRADDLVQNAGSWPVRGVFSQSERRRSTTQARRCRRTSPRPVWTPRARGSGTAGNPDKDGGGRPHRPALEGAAADPALRDAPPPAVRDSGPRRPGHGLDAPPARRAARRPGSALPAARPSPALAAYPPLDDRGPDVPVGTPPSTDRLRVRGSRPR